MKCVSFLSLFLMKLESDAGLQARKKEALVAAAPAVDEAANARLEKEKAEEAQTITQVCNELGVELYEVRPPSFLPIPFSRADARIARRSNQTDTACTPPSPTN